jgi:hypothetical protein
VIAGVGITTEFKTNPAVYGVDILYGYDVSVPVFFIRILSIKIV